MAWAVHDARWDVEARWGAKARAVEAALAYRRRLRRRQRRRQRQQQRRPPRRTRHGGLRVNAWLLVFVWLTWLLVGYLRCVASRLRVGYARKPFR